MASKRRPEEHENHERWLVSYSDFITLLLALFVVMYAISQVNEGKYRVVAGSLVTAFGNQPNQLNREPIAVMAPDSLPPIHGRTGDSARDHLLAKKARRMAEMQRQRQEKMEIIARDIMAAFDPLLKNGQMRVMSSDLGVRVEIEASLLFAPGEALLHEESRRVLGSIAEVLKNLDYAIQVEGHTDNMPVATEKFPSNWELSAVRASSVVRLLIDNGIEPTRLTAVGYGENRPLESNDSEEGRKHNRRVTMMILSTASDLPATRSYHPLLHPLPDPADPVEDPAILSNTISSI